MEQQWQDIKTAYRRVLDTTFRHQDEKDYAHITLLRLTSGMIDLALSGDPAFRRAMIAVLGDENSSTGFGERRYYYGDRGDHDGDHGDNMDHGNRGDHGEHENMNDNVPLSTSQNERGNTMGMGGNLDLNSLFGMFGMNGDMTNSFSRVFRGSSNSDSGNQNNNISNISTSEMRNMFPIFHYMFDEFAGGRGNNGDGGDRGTTHPETTESQQNNHP